MPRYSAFVLLADEGLSGSERDDEVFQRTMSRSFCCFWEDVLKEERSECPEGPHLTTRSEIMTSLTLPTMGTRPHATGADQSAAW